MRRPGIAAAGAVLGGTALPAASAPAAPAAAADPADVIRRIYRAHR